MHPSTWVAVLASAFWHCQVQAEIQKVSLVYSTSLDYPLQLESFGVLSIEKEGHSANITANPKAYSVKNALEDGAEVYRLGIDQQDKHLLGAVRLSALDKAEHYATQLTAHLDTQGDVYHISLRTWPVKSAALAITSIKMQKRPAVDPAQAPILHKKVKKVVEGEPKQAISEAEDALAVEEVEEEVVPKTFLQKYWIYLVPVLLLLVMAPAADEGKEK